MVISKSFLKQVFKILPYKFVRHYIYPLMVRKEKAVYNAGDFFDSWYGAVDEFNDAVTVDLNHEKLLTFYHYNATENSILQHFIKNNITLPSDFEMMDIGPGAGHWIDFYTKYLEAKNITGIEISKVASEKLTQKYSHQQGVQILNKDISALSFQLDKKYDLINAVGVIFHIVEDKAWEQTIANISNQLKINGLAIIGGQFGWLTRNVQFHNTNHFNSADELVSYTSFKELSAESANQILINKRIRSYKYWKKIAHKNGLKIEALIKTKQDQSFIIPENNILILRKQS